MVTQNSTPLHTAIISFLRTPAMVVFLIVLINSAAFIEFKRYTSNYTSRVYLTRALIDKGTVRLDSYSNRLGYDQALSGEHRMSNKPIGSSLLMIPSYLLIAKPVAWLFGGSLAVGDKDTLMEFLVLITSLPLFVALGMVALYKTLIHIGYARNATLLTLLFFFGTLMFPYSTFGVGAMYTAPPLMFGTYWLSRIGEDKRCIFYAGIAFGMAFFISNEAALFCVTAFLYILFSERNIKSLALFCTPIAAFIGLTLLYNYIGFGDWLSFPASNTAPNGRQYPADRQALVFYMKFPSSRRIFQMLFSGGNGLLVFSPFLAFSVLGFWKMWKSPYRRFGIFLLSSFLLFFVAFSFSAAWRGGANLGNRYLVPALFFLCIPTAAWFQNRRIRSYEFLLFLPAVTLCSFGAITSPWINPKFISRPFLGYLWPLFISNGPNSFINQLLSWQGIDNWYVHVAVPLCILGSSVFLYLFRQEKQSAHPIP